MFTHIINTPTNKEFNMREYYKEYAYTRMPKGKYKGHYLKDVPESYLRWAISTWKDNAETTVFKIEIHRREHDVK